MKKKYICSPFRGNIKENTKKAAWYAAVLAKAGSVPLAPHLYFPTFLNENKPNERMLGIELGLELLETCDVICVFGFKITEGMKIELDYAREKGIPVCLYDEEMNPLCVRTLPADERATPEYMEAIKGLHLML